MTTSECLAVLAKEYPNGVSFAPMAVRLLRHKVPFEDCQIEKLKSAMFQLGDDRWFSSAMIVDEESLLAIKGHARGWLKEYGCFSVERLLEKYRGVLRHVTTSETCAAFLGHLGFETESWQGGCFCVESPSTIDACFAGIAKSLTQLLEQADGMLACYEIAEAMPHLTAEVLESVRLSFLPAVFFADVGEDCCWCSTESIVLPEDFSEKITEAIDTIVSLEKNITPSRLEFALSILYKTNFCREHGLHDKDILMRLCVKHYRGENGVFKNIMPSDVNGEEAGKKKKRTRSPNTRFGSLGVPVGSELFFNKNDQISCIVLDDVNQVEYEGKAWAISSLAIHLLGVQSANGYCYFVYEGETLWERRLRLEKAEP